MRLRYRLMENRWPSAAMILRFGIWDPASKLERLRFPALTWWRSPIHRMASGWRRLDSA